MKVIFLDNDGVICLESEWGSRFKKGTDFDRLNTKAVKVLNDIIEQTGAEIVISSDWKLHANLEALNKHYADHGVMKAAIAVTPRYEVKKMSESYDLESNRIKEIQMYLKDHPEVTEWVSLSVDELFERIIAFKESYKEQEKCLSLIERFKNGEKYDKLHYL